MVDLSRRKQTGKRIISEFSEKNLTFMAAGIAYNAFLSLAPILVLLLVVVSAVGGGLEDRIVELAQESFPGPRHRRGGVSGRSRRTRRVGRRTRRAALGDPEDLPRAGHRVLGDLRDNEGELLRR